MQSAINTYSPDETIFRFTSWALTTRWNEVACGCRVIASRIDCFPEIGFTRIGRLEGLLASGSGRSFSAARHGRQRWSFDARLR